jgi:hypothetical protein
MRVKRKVKKRGKGVWERRKIYQERRYVILVRNTAALLILA